MMQRDGSPLRILLRRKSRNNLPRLIWQSKFPFWNIARDRQVPRAIHASTNAHRLAKGTTRSTKAAAAFRSHCIVLMSIWPGTMTQSERKQWRAAPGPSSIGAAFCIVARRIGTHRGNSLYLYSRLCCFSLRLRVSSDQPLTLNYAGFSLLPCNFFPLVIVYRKLFLCLPK